MRQPLDIDNRFLFLFKACNFFALMCYDIGVELNTLVRNFNKENNTRYVYSQKFRTKLRQMEEARQRMNKHAQGVTNELAEKFDEIETEGETKPLTLFLELTDTYDYILEMLSLCLLQTNGDPQELKHLYNLLRQEVRIDKEHLAEYKQPDWEYLENLYYTKKDNG